MSSVHVAILHPVLVAACPALLTVRRDDKESRGEVVLELLTTHSDSTSIACYIGTEDSMLPRYGPLANTIEFDFVTARKEPGDPVEAKHHRGGGGFHLLQIMYPSLEDCLVSASAIGDKTRGIVERGIRQASHRSCPNSQAPLPSPKPCTRWWFLNPPFTKEAIQYQCDWLVDNGFGGVEMAFLKINGDPSLFPIWLGLEFQNLLKIVRKEANARGLTVDFTYGSCWPFGGAGVKREDAARSVNNSGFSSQRLSTGVWPQQQPDDPNDESHRGYVVNHLSRPALLNYHRVVRKGFGPAATMECHGGQLPPPMIFCDSLEMHTEGLWDDALYDEFATVLGYDVIGGVPQFETSVSDLSLLHDCREIRALAMFREFYASLTTDVAHDLGARSRVQCHGSPTDLLRSYGVADIPESESVLFEPNFSVIPASAAALCGKALVSCETFTCAYGFPRGPAMMSALIAHQKEKVHDLKMIFDAVAANGVNHIYYHGMAFNGPDTRHEFYASVEVGPKSAFKDDTKTFNLYMETVCSILRQGKVYSQCGVLLNNDDVWRLGELPNELRTPAARWEWEHRLTKFPDHFHGYRPLWVSTEYLSLAIPTKDSAGMCNGVMVGDVHFSFLAVECSSISATCYAVLKALVNAGVPIVRVNPTPLLSASTKAAVPIEALQDLQDRFLKQPPIPPTFTFPEEFNRHQSPRLLSLPYWVRQLDDGNLVCFVPHPRVREVQYHIRLNQFAPTTEDGERDPRWADGCSFELKLNLPCGLQVVPLEFNPGESILLFIDVATGKVDAKPAAMDSVDVLRTVQ